MKFPKYGNKSLKIFDIKKISEKDEYKTPSTSVENREKLYWEGTSTISPVYGSNIDLTLIDSDDFNLGGLNKVIQSNVSLL